MIIAKSCRFTSVIGNTTIAELESTPKDSDLVGGASLRVCDRRESTTRVRLVRLMIKNYSYIQASVPLILLIIDETVVLGEYYYNFVYTCTQ